MYEQSWKDRDLKSVWELMSPRLQQGNENDERKFEDFVRQSGIWISRIKIRSITVTRDRATVRESVTYASSGKTVGEALEESQWVLVKGNWLFDEGRTLRTSR